jgi:uncharacterized Rmd1/YagE family protein
MRNSADAPHAPVSEVFLFEYGVTVIWGMTEAEEKRFLKEIVRFEVESLRTSSVSSSYYSYPLLFISIASASTARAR